MSTTAPCPLQPAPVEAVRVDRPINRQIACIAAYFGSEAQAQATAAGLARLPGLAPASWVVLGPADAPPLRFERLSRRWAAPFQANRAPPRSPLWRWSGLALLLGTALALLWWLQAGVQDVDPELTPLILSLLLVAAVAGAGLLVWGGGWRRPPRPRRFDRQVQQALAAGRWAVVVQGMSWAAQPGAVDLLRSGSLGWCAEPARGARL